MRYKLCAITTKLGQKKFWSNLPPLGFDKLAVNSQCGFFTCCLMDVNAWATYVYGPVTTVRFCFPCNILLSPDLYNVSARTMSTKVM